MMAGTKHSVSVYLDSLGEQVLGFGVINRQSLCLWKGNWAVPGP